MKKYYKIQKVHSNFIAIDLIEDDKTIGGYIALIHGIAKKHIIESIKKEGYINYRKAVKFFYPEKIKKS